MDYLIKILGCLCLTTCTINCILITVDLIRQQKRQKQLEKEFDETVAKIQENINKTKDQIEANNKEN